MVGTFLWSFIFEITSYSITTGCPSFNNVVHSLPYIGSPDAKCVNDRECTSINCTVSTQTSPSSVGLVLKSCDRDPSVEIHADIPSAGVNRWSATFSDGTEHIIPGYFLPDSGQKLQGYLRIDLKTLPGSQILMLSMSLKGCGLRNESHCAVSKKLLNDQYITCIARPVVPCSINIPFQCGENETCRQGTAAGDACECLMGFERSPDGSCNPLDLKEERNGTSSSESVKQSKKDTVIDF